MKWIRKATLGLSTVAAVLLVIGYFALRAFGGELQYATTDSMAASGLPKGTLFITVPVAGEDIEDGDYISAYSPMGVPVMHEAIAAPVLDANNRLSLPMKGSSNPDPDPDEYDVTDGAQRVVGWVPGAGYAFSWIKQNPHLSIGILIVLAALIFIPFGRSQPSSKSISVTATGNQAS